MWGGEMTILGRPQMTTWSMHIACWLPKATNILSTRVTHLFSHCNDYATRLNVNKRTMLAFLYRESPSLISSRGIKGRCCSNDGLSHHYTM